VVESGRYGRKGNQGSEGAEVWGQRGRRGGADARMSVCLCTHSRECDRKSKIKFYHHLPQPSRMEMPSLRRCRSAVSRAHETRSPGRDPHAHTLWRSHICRPTSTSRYICTDLSARLCSRKFAAALTTRSADLMNTRQHFHVADVDPQESSARAARRRAREIPPKPRRHS
jgi:hypothetical protein